MSDLRLIGDPILREVLPEIRDFSDTAVTAAMASVITTLGSSLTLIGLAANQVGHSARLFALKEGETMRVYFNPSVIRASNTLMTEIEGCGSIPDRHFRVARPVSIVARWAMPNGALKVEHLHGVRARAFQHELDHLNGILISDHGEEVFDEQLQATSKPE